MDLTILTIVFLTSNLWGMYRHVPFTNISPSRSFLERAISSFQITGAVYPPEIYPLVFTEIVQDHDARLKDNPPFPPEIDEIIQRVMEEYMDTRNVTHLTPYRVPTDTAGSDGGFDPHITGMHLRKCLHPQLHTPNGMVKAVCKGLALASLGFSLLFFIWKENNTPVDSSGDSLATSTQNITPRPFVELAADFSVPRRVSQNLERFHAKRHRSYCIPESKHGRMGEFADHLDNIGNRVQLGYEATQDIIKQPKT